MGQVFSRAKVIQFIRYIGVDEFMRYHDVRMSDLALKPDNVADDDPRIDSALIQWYRTFLIQANGDFDIAKAAYVQYIDDQTKDFERFLDQREP